MKRILIVGMLVIGGWAHATLVSQTFNSGASVGTVSQGSPVGTAFTGTFSAANGGDTVLGIILDLTVTGGYSGGFYMYLVGPDSSTTVTLLNTPGTSTTGLNLGFDDTGSTITSSSVLSSGTWAPYQPLSGLNGQTANGTWTLYFADLASGGGDATLSSWTLNIDVVPEPVNMALGVFGVMFVVIMVVRQRAEKLAGKRPE